jgi:hypothetical protein
MEAVNAFKMLVATYRLAADGRADERSVSQGYERTLKHAFGKN